MSLADDAPNVIPRRQFALFVKGADGQPNEKLIQDLEDQQNFVFVDVTAAVMAAQATADAAALVAALAESELNGSTFLTVGAEPGLTVSRRIVAGAGLTATDAGAGSTYTLASSDQNVILPNDVSDVTAAFVNVTAMLGVLAASSVYMVDGVLTFQSAAVTTGIGLAWTLPAGATISGAYDHNVTNTTAQQAFNIAAGAVSANTTDVPAAATNTPLRGRWLIRTGVTAGNAQLQFRTEVAASSVTIKKDLSALVFRKIG